MTDMTKVADSSAFRFWMPIINSVLASAIVGVGGMIVVAFGELRTQVASGQLNQALVVQDVSYLKKDVESGKQDMGVLKITVQGHEYQLKAISDYLKQDATTRRPRS